MCNCRSAELAAYADQSLRVLAPTTACMQVAYDALEREMGCIQRNPAYAQHCVGYLNQTVLPLLDQVWENLVVLRKQIEEAQRGEVLV